MLNLEKGQSLSLVKRDGSRIPKIRVGLSWDVASVGRDVDLDLFIVQLPQNKVAYFNDKTAIKGLKLSDDNLTGEGEGDDEFVKLDAAQTDDGDYFICVNIYEAKARNQAFNLVNNAKATIYNDETNDALASYSISTDGGKNTALIVAKIKDTGAEYQFEALGNYVTGNINEVCQHIMGNQ